MALMCCGGEDEMNRLLEERRQHQEKGENGYESKRRDKKLTQQSWNGKTRTLGESSTSKDAIDMITFDFQQNLPTPHLHHNDMFYLRQLWTFNFGIHDCINEQGYMFLWSETTAKRGSSEVASCLHKFFSKFKSGARLVVCCCTLFNQKKTVSLQLGRQGGNYPGPRGFACFFFFSRSGEHPFLGISPPSHAEKSQEKPLGPGQEVKSSLVIFLMCLVTEQGTVKSFF